MRSRLVVATPVGLDEFYATKPTGQTFERSLSDQCDILLYPSNTAGLSRVYNDAIERSKDEYDTLIFCHDDVFFVDHHWLGHCHDGMQAFDIIGVAGSVRPVPGQVAWCFEDEHGTRVDKEKMAGSIAHGTSWPPKRVNRLGPSRIPVDLIDGVFVACRMSALIERNLRFDERFDFHFYDVDFCLAARQAGLTLGVWDIALMHESRGQFGTESWHLNRLKYLQKWNSSPVPQSAA
ncbi:glycosyl transferase family 2 [Rhodobacter viridis]|uniref:Glycosyl transferase family 2 n=1 Tax=Rhodobacter viridis TaxID=1054202 RepID=A0A318U3C3_9RHOB|nr:glycosyltransferase [Rhodobacter viridis]PYF12998.1 glycosyl transferase family 2 [Rhodobacter viridis]